MYLFCLYNTPSYTIQVIYKEYEKKKKNSNGLNKNLFELCLILVFTNLKSTIIYVHRVHYFIFILTKYFLDYLKHIKLHGSLGHIRNDVT